MLAVPRLAPRALGAALAALLAAPAAAQSVSAETGAVDVGEGLATIELPAGWSYLQRRDARAVVETVWGNPPDETVVGLAVPPGEDPAEPYWAVVVSFEDTGYVEDGDAAGLDYAELLAEMQSDTRDANSVRRERGYTTVDLLGWAEPPHYDAAEKKLYWAQRLRFQGSDVDTLNYCVRVLGRRGVLLMNAVADFDQLPEVAVGAKELLAATEFGAGHRYADFDRSIDRVAAVGIGGLIAGKVLAKAGILKMLLLFLAKAWKLVLVGGAVVVAGAAKRRGKRSAAGAEPAAGDAPGEQRRAA